MAIFIALLFQLLFIFFAMVINVGLLVHDKINLQNSVDLATIYAAQRQAEVLNVIAHTNYQIHQSWKLLAWRIRVLGDFGRTSHPSNPGSYTDPYAIDSPDTYLANYPPSVCVDNPGWESNDDQNLCKDRFQYVDPITIAQRNPLADWTQIYAALEPYAQQAQAAFRRGCKEVGPKNWNMAGRWLASFRLDVERRREIIKDLALNLKQNDFREISGGQVMDGVRRTLRANLTRSNLAALDKDDIIFKNSLADREQKDWLPEIYVSPVLYYTDTVCPDDDRIKVETKRFGPGGGSLPNYLGGREATWDPTGAYKNFWSYEPVDNNSPFRSIWGVEKNPWYLAYVGLKVTTKPKQPFSPFGKGVEMVARAFAQPFGGKIGPWFKRQWQPTDPMSSGDAIDEMAPERDGGAFTPNPLTQIPNYSRYPGDKMGLTSIKALSMLRKFREEPGRVVSFRDYTLVESDPMTPQGDVLANNPILGPGGTFIRGFEVAALSPNFFDVMYYSIEPSFVQNYAGRANSLVSYYPPGTLIRQDLGGRNDPPDRYSVQRQIEQYMKIMIYLGSPNLYEWQVITEPAHLLTSWVPQQIVDYSPTPAQFAQCDMTPTPAFDADPTNPIPVPGRCLAGGRVGYSVKIVSREHLQSPELEFGGPGVIGPIKNPPPEDF